MDQYFDVDQLRELLAPGISVQDALELLREDDIGDQRPEMVYMVPPSPAVVTDEESGDEEEDGDIHHLPGRQLLAPAEVVFSSDLRTPVDLEDAGPVVLPAPYQNTDMSSPSNNVPNIITSISCDSVSDEWIRERLVKGKPVPVFIEGDFEKKKNRIFPPTTPLSPADSPTEMFERFFTDEIFDYIAKETNNYALFGNFENPRITKEEIKCFFGLMIYSGYAPVPSMRQYWDSQEDLKSELVTNAMRRNRMYTIKKFIHFADNGKVDPHDKIWKLRPLMDKIRDKCIENLVPSEHMNYDESMVKFFGRHNMKQFLPGKPIRFGYKMWCINSSDGYLVNFDLYQGSDPKIPDQYNQLFGKCSAPFVFMLNQLPPSVQKLPIDFFFDNLFSGPNLFRYLKWRGYSATGTFRENRIPKSGKASDSNKTSSHKSLKATKRLQNQGANENAISLPEKKGFAKEPRGTYSSVLEKNDGIMYIRWRDNGVVTMGSTDFGVQPITYVTRYSREKKKNIKCPRPAAIAVYNKGMGGTDQMDANIGAYRIAMRSKKFYWPIFTWLVDAAMQNAWVTYRKTCPISQLNFRRHIATQYLKTYATPKRRPGPSTPLTSRVNIGVRYDRIDHYASRTHENKRLRCALEVCTSQTRMICQKCNVGLCLDCFLVYHTE